MLKVQTWKKDNFARHHYHVTPCLLNLRTMQHFFHCTDHNRFFSCYAPHLWNQIPEPIKIAALKKKNCWHIYHFWTCMEQRNITVNFTVISLCIELMILVIYFDVAYIVCLPFVHCLSEVALIGFDAMYKYNLIDWLIDWLSEKTKHFSDITCKNQYVKITSGHLKDLWILFKNRWMVVMMKAFTFIYFNIFQLVRLKSRWK